MTDESHRRMFFVDPPELYPNAIAFYLDAHVDSVAGKLCVPYQYIVIQELSYAGEILWQWCIDERDRRARERHGVVDEPCSDTAADDLSGPRSESPLPLDFRRDFHNAMQALMSRTSPCTSVPSPFPASLQPYIAEFRDRDAWFYLTADGEPWPAVLHDVHISHVFFM